MQGFILPPLTRDRPVKSSTTKSQKPDGGEKKPRVSLTAPQSYFLSEKPDLSFVPSGCTLLDCALGNGYPIGRVVNIVGDRSTAKTGLAMEAIINFMKAYPTGLAAYRETEAAFDKGYAEAMGLPIKEVDFGPSEPLNTVEDFARDFDKFLDARIKTKTPGIYVLDSLDALSDEAEMERDIGKGSYQMEKAKMLSTFFRKSAAKIEKAKVLLLIISQVRDNVGALFGEKHKRSGGRALDFYSTITLWLSHIETLTKTINKVKRPIGIMIKAKCKKNKIALPFREAQFSYLFGYGIKDEEASLEWLDSIGRLDDITVDSTADEIKAAVKKVWAEVEQSFLPQKAKYS